MEIKVKVKKLEKKVLMLTEHFGNGTLGETKFDASFSIPHRHLIVEIGKCRYMVNSQDIISEIVDYHDKSLKK